jgi:AraC family transcriptional regulator
VQSLAAGEFYGQVVRRTICCGATLSVVRHAQARELPLHSHELPYFCLLVEGRYSETYAGRTIAYEPFSVALHPAKYSHSDVIGASGASFFTLELGDEWHDRLRDLVDLHNVEVRLAPDDVGWAGLRILREIMQTDEPSKLLVESLLYEMLAAFAPPVHDMRAPCWLGTAKAYIGANLSDTQTMAQIASAAGVHPVSLARGFREREGLTVGEYVNRARIARACQALSDPGARIADIALDLGYVDQSHLTRVFKNVTGMTPGAFRSTVLQSRPPL